MPCFGKISLSNTFLSQNRMVKSVQEVYFGLGGVISSHFIKEKKTKIIAIWRFTLRYL